ncbi:MAG TPA: cell division protein [Agrobacterium sp.]|uniref:AAA family ATPase n=1 Tax=Rhizobium sp. TaxID=391 RepID=UPI000E89115F|nr:cell division protein [Agrobacterium sp.]
MSDHLSLEYQIACLHLRRALRPFRRAGRFLVAVVLPDRIDEASWKSAARSVLLDMLPQTIEIGDDDDERGFRPARRSYRAHDVVDMIEGKIKGQPHDPIAALSIGESRTVGLIRRTDATRLLSHPSLAVVDAVLDIPEVDPALVPRAVRLAFSEAISPDEAKDVLAMSAELRAALPQGGRSFRALLAGWRVAQSVSVAKSPSVASSKAQGEMRLEDLRGYGEAATWGLELKRDLADYSAGHLAWHDVDTGLLLSGPPGTGKTTFAKALATSCDVPFLTGSYSSWQAAGHQGDMLKAMRKTFDAARANAPCILLIDEVDAFVDRGKSGEHQEYMRGVVNGLLEHLDGAVERPGVVVIGACNDPCNVDAALRRPGRFDRHIAIALPDADARAHILRYHLQADLHLGDAIALTEGCSGADLERIARDARRLARRSGMAVVTGHVLQALPPVRMIPADEVRATAIHELGHAVVGVVLGYRRLKRVVVHDKVLAGASVAGFASFDNEPMMRRDRRFMRADVCVNLASLAAEQMVFGDHCDGVALDLQQATEIATWMVTVAGMGDDLVSSGSFAAGTPMISQLRQPAIATQVEAILQEELVRARQIVARYRGVIETLADRLILLGSLDGAVVEAAVAEHDRAAQLSLAFTK